MKERCLNIEATNETFSTRVNVLEKCRYYVSQNCIKISILLVNIILFTVNIVRL